MSYDFEKLHHLIDEDEQIQTRVEIDGQEVKPNLRQRLGLWMMHRGTHLLAGPRPKPRAVRVQVDPAEPIWKGAPRDDLPQG